MSYKQPIYQGGYSSEYNRLGHSNLSRPNLTPARNFKEDSIGSFGQLEQLLERQRQKYRDMKDKLELDVDQERKHRIQFQNKLIKLKDEINRKDTLLSEFEFRENNILHQMEDTQIENEKLKAELARMEDVYGHRIAELETQLGQKTREFEEFNQQCNVQFDKFKKEGQEYVQSLTFEHDRKKKVNDDKIRQAENLKKDLMAQNKRINDLLVQNKLMYQQEIRELSSRIRDEQGKKSHLQTKSFDQRVKSLEDARQVLNRKNLEMMRAIQDKQRQLQELDRQRHDQVQRVRLQVADLLNKNSQLNMLYEKVKNELVQRDAMINRNTGENSQESAYLKQQIEQKRKQIDTLNGTIRDLRQAVKDSSTDFERRRTELTEKCNYFQSEAKKNKDQYIKICETLKARINETITNVSYK